MISRLNLEISDLIVIFTRFVDLLDLWYRLNENRILPL